MEQLDHDSGSNRNHSDTVESKMDSPNENEKKQSRSQPQTPPSDLTVTSSGLTVTPSQKLPINRNQESESNDDDTPSKQRRCNCKASRCLKLYCECFALGLYCNGCNCLNCNNTLEKENARQEAIKAALERNPDAFKAKIAGSPHGLNDLQEHVRQLVILGKHNKGCHCKRSGCLKKYCECYQANVRCSENCRCQDCKNFEGSEEIQQTTNAAVKVAIGMSPESRKRKIKAASHSVAARGSSAVPGLVQNQTVNYVIRNGDTSLFTVPNNQVVSGSTTSTYRSSLSNTIQMRYAKELCSLLVSKSVEVANKFSDAKCEADKRRKNEKDSPLDPAQRDANVINDSPDCVLHAGRMDEKPVSPATRALICDDEHVNILEKETPVLVRTSQEKEDKDKSSEVYSEQEKQILSYFRDYLLQILNRRLINGRNIQNANIDPSRKEPEDKEQNNRDSSLGA